MKSERKDAVPQGSLPVGEPRQWAEQRVRLSPEANGVWTDRMLEALVKGAGAETDQSTVDRLPTLIEAALLDRHGEVIGSIGPLLAVLIILVAGAALQRDPGGVAAGNAIVLKPAEITPRTTLRLAELAQDIFPRVAHDQVAGGSNEDEIHLS